MECRQSAVSISAGINDAGLSTLCVPALIEERAALTPDALAVTAGNDRLTYAELDRRSNQLGHYLCSLGVNTGAVVGLCLERTVRFPVAALAILKTGAAYLPLDPKTPVERLKMMLGAARVPLVLTQSSLAGSLAVNQRQAVALESCAAELSRFSFDALHAGITPEHLAYIIYTSGSTGTPKGVQIGHDNLLNLIRWHCRAFGVTPTDRATQLASIGFDAAVWELWPHLVAGASVHLVDDEARAQPDKLRDWLVREKITISFVPTPVAEQMIQLPWPADTALRLLLTGGDTLRHHPAPDLPFPVVNNYGPTECTVVATSATIAAGEDNSHLPPIGRPIDNTEILILDGSKKRLPAGQVGELYIGGAGLARGYLNDPAMTADRFVSDPFSATPGAKLYRTGDLGCYLPDGQIAFRGRLDDQVKIRGHRIELNEVTSALVRHPAIAESFVVASDEGTGEKRLVAYIVPRANASPSVNDLRGFLGKELPDYMLPAAFISLEALPVGPNGKVDRSALPAPNDANTLRDAAFLGPSTPTEERIAGILAALLGVERVSVHDNFFLLGGNSLLGTQVIARLRSAFEVEVPLLDLFDHPTVVGLAEVVEQLMVANLDAMSEEEAQRRLAALGSAET
jgi:amino acid adenylation domain-containing protein